MIICHAFNMPNEPDPPIKMSPFDQMSTHTVIVNVPAVICTNLLHTSFRAFQKSLFLVRSSPLKGLASCKKIHHTMHATMVLSKKKHDIPSFATIAFDSTQVMYHGYTAKSWHGTISNMAWPQYFHSNLRTLENTKSFYFPCR